MSPATKRRSGSTRHGSSHHPSTEMETLDKLFPSKEEWLRLAAVLGGAILVACTCNFLHFYFRKDLAKPFYCGPVSFDSQHNSPDQCKPCPENGECYDGKVECFHGYKEQGYACVNDGYTDEQAKKLSRWIENQLCESYAQFLCYGYGRAWMSEENIWNNVANQKLTDMDVTDDVSFSLTKSRTIKNVGASLDMRLTTDGIKEFKCADQFVNRYKPFSCKVRHWILEHIVYVALSCLMALSLLLLGLNIRRKWYLESRAEQLYQQICGVLEDNALASRNGSGNHDAWIVSSWLRDQLLLPRERKQNLLWKKIVDMVQEDSRIDMFPKMVKGESKVVWEWQVEGALSSDKVRNKGESRKWNLSRESEVPHLTAGRVEIKKPELMSELVDD